MSIVFVISAPSGSGKSTLVKNLMALDGNLAFATSVTTRPPRADEVDGEAYRFVTLDEFVAMRDNDALLEWAEVFGHFYGTPRSAVDDARRLGRDLLLDIDVQGAASLLEKLPEAVTIFILPPSRPELQARLERRGSDEPEVIRRRLRESAREVGEYASYGHIVVNDDLDEATRRLHAILLAERARRENMEQALAPILRSFGIESDTD